MQPPPPPGILELIQGTPNPHGAPDAAVYLCRGDATAAPVTAIMPAEGVQWPPERPASARPVRLKLLHFNDLHGCIAAFTAQGTVPLFSRIAAWMQSTRTRYAEDPRVAVLAVSVGDESGGVIFDELLGSSPETYQVHAGYRLYSQAGIDAGVIGNHDLDRGAAVLAHAIRQDARFPVLAANVTGSEELAAACYPAALFVVKGVRVGFIGLVTPAQIRPDPHSPRRVTDPLAAAHHLISAIRPHCDVLVVLSHLGYSLRQHSAAVRIAGDMELAQSLPPGAVHLIIGGHTHNSLNEGGLGADHIVNGIPIVQAGKFGQFVGEVDLTVGHTAVVSHVQLRALSDLPVDDAFEQVYVQPLVAQVQPYRQRVLGRVVDDEDVSEDAVRNNFACGESALANFVTDALACQCRARGYAVDCAMIDATSVYGGLRPGSVLTFGDWFDVMPFADTVCFVRLSARQLCALLKDNARRIDRPDQAHTERGFLHLSAEVRYIIDLGAARGEADVAEMRVDGRPLEEQEGRTFMVATTSFVRGPAAAWESHPDAELREPLFALGVLSAENTGLYVRDLLVAHIKAHGGVLPEGGAQRDGRLQVSD